MSLIPASSVSLKTMADGTLRISFDVEPGHAQDCFQLFASPGTQAVIAALKDGSFLAQSKQVDETGRNEGQTSSKPLINNEKQGSTTREQLGDACYRTVQWCNEPSFWAFLNTNARRYSSNVVLNSGGAAYEVREICNVESRKELDTNPEANKTWHREIRQPYADYLKRIEAA